VQRMSGGNTFFFFFFWWYGVGTQGSTPAKTLLVLEPLCQPRRRTSCNRPEVWKRQVPAAGQLQSGQMPVTSLQPAPW
jgi:hypothetical protein